MPRWHHRCGDRVHQFRIRCPDRFNLNRLAYGGTDGLKRLARIAEFSVQRRQEIVTETERSGVRDRRAGKLGGEGGEPSRQSRDLVRQGARNGQRSHHGRPFRPAARQPGWVGGAVGLRQRRHGRRHGQGQPASCGGPGALPGSRDGGRGDDGSKRPAGHRCHPAGRGTMPDAGMLEASRPTASALSEWVCAGFPAGLVSRA